MDHTFTVSRKTSNLPLQLLLPPIIQFAPLFQLKPLKSPLLACDPPQATGPAHRLRIPSYMWCSSVPQSGRQSLEVRACGSKGVQSRKRRLDQRSSRRTALNQGVRDEIKSTELEILLTSTHTTIHDNTMALIFIFAYDHPDHVNLTLILPTHFKSIIIWGAANDLFQTSKTVISVARLFPELYYLRALLFFSSLLKSSPQYIPYAFF